MAKSRLATTPSHLTAARGSYPRSTGVSRRQKTAAARDRRIDATFSGSARQVSSILPKSHTVSNGCRERQFTDGVT